MNLSTLKEIAVTRRPPAMGSPIIDAAFKSEPQDFLVHESLGFNFSGEGEHLFLLIRKCGLNTNDILLELQRVFKVNSADIGLCGQKDKRGITEQWFSVRSKQTAELVGLPVNQALLPLNQSLQPLSQALQLPTKDVPIHLESGQFVVLDQQRHGKKLRFGAHKHNWFGITLRHCRSLSQATEPLAHEALQTQVNDRLEKIQQQGFANYFGEQRFGFGQQNLDKALRYFTDTRRKMSRHQRAMAISAARSALFNCVCAQRIYDATWSQILPGELVQLNSTASYFKAELNDNNVQQRADKFDVHPTGPLWGRGQPEVGADCAALEQAVMSEYAPLCAGLEKVGLQQQRRSLRAVVEHLDWHWSDTSTLHFRFVLSQGVYATSMLSELARLSSAVNVSPSENANFSA